MFWCIFYTHISIFNCFLYHYWFVTSKKARVMSVLYTMGFPEPSNCLKVLSICWQKEEREGGKEDGWQQFLRLNLVLCSGMESASIRKPASPAPLWLALCCLMVPRESKVSQASFHVKEKCPTLFSAGAKTPTDHSRRRKDGKIKLVFLRVRSTPGRAKVHSVR